MGNKRVPEVRFEGFNGDWEERKFSNIVGRVSKQSNDATLPKVEFEDIVSGEGRLNKDILKKFDARKGIVFEPNFILFGKLRPYLKNWLLPNFKGIALGDFWVFEPKNSYSIFNYYLIQTDKYQIVANLSSGTKMPRSDWKTVSETEFRIPSIEEQTKIGNFFKQLDDTIALHQQELTTLKQTKQGFLQKMFPKEGESVPEVRFTGFKGEWEQRKLINEIIEKVLDYRGKSPTKFGMKWGNSGYLVLSALNVKDGYIDKRVEAKYGDQTLFERWMGKERLEKGDVVFTTEAPLGNVAQVPDDNGYILNQRAVAFKTSKEKTDNNFLAQLLRSPLFQTKLQAIASGGTAKGIGMKEFAKMSVNVPVLVEEQTKIGHFFKQLDDTIALHQRELDALKVTKKAFLQKMFV